MSSLLQQIKSLDLNKQNALSPGDNISIDENNVISSIGGSGTLPEDATFTSVNTGTLTTGTSFFTDKLDITNALVLITDQAVNITSQLILKGNTFDTIILRRISGDTTLYIRETQLWIDDINIFINNTQPSQNKDNLSLGDTIEFLFKMRMVHFQQEMLFKLILLQMR